MTGEYHYPLLCPRAKQHQENNKSTPFLQVSQYSGWIRTSSRTIRNSSAIGILKFLSHIFDLEGALSSGVVIDPTRPPDSHIKDREVLLQLRARKLQAIRQAEMTSKRSEELDEATKHKAFIEASRLFSGLIESPTYASSYNNKAQLSRWRYGDEALVKRHNTSNCNLTSLSTTLKSVVNDLNTAIKLATPASPSDPVSPSQAKLLAQAHTQRAILFYIV